MDIKELQETLKQASALIGSLGFSMKDIDSIIQVYDRRSYNG